MSQYNPVTPTIQGQAMIAESLKTKTGLVFTKVEWGDGIVSRGEQYPTFTALKNKVIESPISKMERQDATLYITSVVNNSTLSTGFYCREIGVWAKIGANGTEQLFAYTYAENASYTPSSNQYNEKRIRIGLGVDANVNVTIKFNSEVYLTRQELEDHDADSAAHDAAFTAHNTDPTAHPDIRQTLSQKADKTYVDGRVANLVNSAPETLNTLNKLATALGNDPNFATTVSKNIGVVDAKANTNASNITALQTSDNAKFKGVSVSNATLTFTKGDNTTTAVTVNNVANATNATNAVYASKMHWDLGSFAGKTIADLRTALMSAAISIGAGNTGYVSFTANFINVVNGWETTTATLTTGGYCTVRISNVSPSDSGYFHGTIHRHDVPEYTFSVINGVWSSLNRNLVQSDYDTLNSAITTILNNKADKTYVDGRVANLVNSAPATLDTLKELATALGNDPNFATTVSTQIGQKVDKTELNDKLALHNTDVNAHQPILNAIKAISGMSAYNIAPSKTIDAIITLLGLGGIVASKLDVNAGFVKFANSFTIQWGRDDNGSDEHSLWVTFPIAFAECFSVIPCIIGASSDSIKVGNFNNTGFEKVSYFNFKTDRVVARPCLWIAVGKA